MKIDKNSYFLFLTILLVAILLQAANLSAEIIDSIVAVVNEEIITASELEEAMSLVIEGMSNASAEEKEAYRKDLKKETLERLIIEKIQLQEAKKLDLEAPDAAVEEMAANIKTQNNITSEEEFQKALKQEGISYETFRDRLFRQLTIKRLIMSEVSSKIKIEEAEINQYYQEHIKDYTTPAQFQVGYILIEVKESDPENQKTSLLEAAQSIQNELSKSTEILDQAQFESNSFKYLLNDRIIWQDLGVMKKGEMRPELEEVIETLEPGKVSKVLQLEGSYHILYLFDKKPELVKSLEEVKESIDSYLFDQKIGKAVDKYLEELKRKSSIKILLQ